MAFGCEGVNPSEINTTQFIEITSEEIKSYSKKSDQKL
jgi:hypothetical protein